MPTSNTKTEKKSQITCIYGFPIQTFDPENLLAEMLAAKDGTMFLLGEKRIKRQEGDDSLELTFAEIKKARD